MIASTLRDNPILAGTVAALLVLLVILLLRIFVGSRVASGKRVRTGAGGPRREPGFSEERFADDYGPVRDDPLADVGGGRRYRFRGLVLAFLLGVAVGYGGLALAGRPEIVTEARALVAGLLAEAAARIGGGTKTPQPTPEKPAVSGATAEAITPPPAFDRGAAAASFVKRMKRALPREVDASTTLVRVDVDDDEVITLGFSLAEVVPPESFKELGDRLKRHFDETVCQADKPDELRVLNDAGVTFWIVYSDQVGTTVARMLIAPKYCERLGMVSRR